MSVLLALFLAVQQPSGLAISNVTVIDIATGGRAPGSTVLIKGNRITTVGPSASVTIPSGARRVDGRGKYLVPGLWDMHVHLSMTGRSALALTLANGVTGVRDMGGDFSRVIPWRDSVATGTMPGPRVVTAGPIVERGNWIRAVRGLGEKLKQPGLIAEMDRRLPLDSASDGPRRVDSLAKLGVDFIKIRNFPSPPVYFPFARAARERGLRIAGHAPPVAIIGQVSDSGFASIEHSVIDFVNGGLVGGFDATAPADRSALFARMARNGTAFDPTLVSSKARFIADSTIERMIADSSAADRPELRFASPSVRREWRDQLEMRKVDDKLDWGPTYQSTLRDVREMAAAGMLILAGTDVPVVTLIPGYSLHDELELLVREAGLTPLAALAASTINAAKVLGVADSIGQVKPGFVADLILLDRDPTRDIRATRALSVVIRNGRLFARADLDRLREAGKM